MAIPWLLALKAIPWTTLIANAPAILRSADALRSKAGARPETSSPTDDVQEIAERLALLEQRDRETAELLARLTGQVSALTAAGEVLEARVRWLFVAALAACTLSVAAIAVALFSR
jgi:hypothetical protein